MKFEIVNSGEEKEKTPKEEVLSSLGASFDDFETKLNASVQYESDGGDQGFGEDADEIERQALEAVQAHFASLRKKAEEARMQRNLI